VRYYLIPTSDDATPFTTSINGNPTPISEDTTPITTQERIVAAIINKWIKLTVGELRGSRQKVQYCITAIEFITTEKPAWYRMINQSLYKSGTKVTLIAKNI